jgi:glutamate-1-semialdehyde 2,1-aminomutase
MPPRVSARAATARSRPAAAGDPDLDDYLHLYLHNRGILLTPFNMALTCPATTEADIDLHTEVLTACVDELVGA